MFQWFKPEVSVYEYGPKLRALLEELCSGYDDSDAFGPDRIGQYLRERTAWFERLNARRLELEAVRAEKRLSYPYLECQTCARHPDGR